MIILLSPFSKKIVTKIIYIDRTNLITRVIIMQDNDWLDLDFDEIEEPQEKKKTKNLSKRRWREIEAYKDQQQQRKVMDINEHYYSM